MKKVVIYPGRLQPMLPHHAKVYTQLQAQFPEAEVYISTSDKVEPGKSPFNFKEKAEIMAQMHNIPMDKIIQAKSPYLVDSYAKSFDQENTMVIFAVGAKDEDRFPMKNVDSETGLDMTVRGEARPKYYQMINTLKQHPALPMSERGYVYNAPTVKSDNDEVASASAFRNAFVNAPDEGSRQEIFNKYMGAFDNNIYALFTNKLLDKKMKEDIYNIDVMKFLAGQLNEAPVDFGDDEEDEYKPGFTQDNMINQLGKIIDSDDASKDVDAMKIKKFTPVTKVTTDDGAEVDVKPAEAKALKDMFNMLSSARQGEEESARERFQKLIQTSQGLDNMLNFAREKGLVKEETLGNDIPQIDLSDIKADYGIEESDMSLEDKLKDAIAQHKEQIEYYNSRMAELENDPEFQNADDDEKFDMIRDYTDDTNVQDEKDKLEHFEKALADYQENGTTHWWQSAFVDVDTDVRDDIAQELRDMGAWRGDLEEAKKNCGCGQDPCITYGKQDVEEGEGEGEYSYTLEYNGEENGMSKHILTITNPEGESKVVGDDFTYFDQEGDELQAELESWFHKGMGVADASVDESIEESACGCCGNDPCDCPKDCKGCMEESADLDQLKKLAGL